MVQSDRTITNFYDPSTYCYTSKLLINLRNKTEADTGSYVAKLKNHEELGFHLFVPSKCEFIKSFLFPSLYCIYLCPFKAGKRNLLGSEGTTLNVTVSARDTSIIVPCLVANDVQQLTLSKEQKVS